MNEIEKNALEKLIVIRKHDTAYTLKCPHCFGEYQNFVTMRELDQLSLGEIEGPQFSVDFGRFLVQAFAVFGPVTINQTCDHHFSIKLN